MKILSNLSQPDYIAPLRRWWVKHWQQSVSLTLATLIVISLWKLSWVQTLENGLYNTWTRWQGSLPGDVPIAIVELDEASLRELDRSTWGRQLYAPLIRHLVKANPAAIVLDTLLPGVDSADADLVAAMAQSGQVVLVQAWDQTGRPVLTNPDLIQAAAAVGYVQPGTNWDGTTRWIPSSTKGLPTLGIATVQVYAHRVAQQPPRYSFAPLLHLVHQDIGFHRFSTQIIHYPIAAVLSETVPLKNFQNKIVLVGMAVDNTMSAAFNQRFPMAPVDLQAALINNLLQQRFLTLISEVKVAGLLLIANLLLLVGSLTWRWQQQMLLWLGASLGWLILGWIAFNLHYGLPIVIPLLWFSLTGGLLLGTHVVKAFLTLRRNETRYMLMLEGFNGGIWDWDLKTNQFYFSPRWQQMLGYDSASLSDQPQEWFDRVHPLDRLNLEIALADYLQADYSQTNDVQNATKAPFEQEYRLLHQDGGYRWMQSRGVAIRNSLGKVERLVGSQIEITAQKQAEEELWRSTFFDRLTDLPSWAGFMKHLQQAINQAQKDDPMQFAVLWLDLDQFKLVNNSLGSTLGDHLLVAIAERLTSFLSLNEVVARLGEDEFAILLRHIQDSETAVQVAQQIQQRLADPFNLDDHEVFVTGSIGIVLGTSHDRNPESLLRDAGTAMYRAKAMGRSSLVVFDKNMRTGMLVKLRLESDLRRAIAEGERQSQILRAPLPEDTIPALATAPGQLASGQFTSDQFTPDPATGRSTTSQVAGQVADVGIGMRPDSVVTAERYPQLELYYQPIVQLNTGQVRGFEALVRWQHAEQGLLFPSRFISMAEETGLIIPLSWWVLRTACRQMNQWRCLFPENQDLTMSVNLSSKQFAMPGLTEQIHQILQENNLKPAYLKLELTESMVMENMDSVVDVLDQLQASGIRLAIDDFGTGYSSLSYLPRFPITTLKIDRSFIDRIGHPDQNLETNSHLEIIRAILTLARNLQMDVVAEGIETETQATYLREMGCEYGQGFFFHKPLDVHSATALLSR